MDERFGNAIPAQNRRLQPRAQSAMQIEYEHFSAAGDKTAEGTAMTVNMSGRGALIEVSHDFPNGGSLILWLNAPFYTMLFRAQIVQTRASANGSYLLGVQLTDVIEGRWETLQQLVQSAPEKPA